MGAAYGEWSNTARSKAPPRRRPATANPKPRVLPKTQNPKPVQRGTPDLPACPLLGVGIVGVSPTLTLKNLPF